MTDQLYIDGAFGSNSFSKRPGAAQTARGMDRRHSSMSGPQDILSAADLKRQVMAALASDNTPPLRLESLAARVEYAMHVAERAHDEESIRTLECLAARLDYRLS
jgi:hypothetical protein